MSTAAKFASLAAIGSALLETAIREGGPLVIDHVLALIVGKNGHQATIERVNIVAAGLQTADTRADYEWPPQHPTPVPRKK